MTVRPGGERSRCCLSLGANEKVSSIGSSISDSPSAIRSSISDSLSAIRPSISAAIHHEGSRACPGSGAARDKPLTIIIVIVCFRYIKGALSCNHVVVG